MTGRRLGRRVRRRFRDCGGERADDKQRQRQKMGERPCGWRMSWPESRGGSGELAGGACMEGGAAGGGDSSAGQRIAAAARQREAHGSCGSKTSETSVWFP